MTFISLFCREMKIEKEIFPAGTDSRFLREVTFSFSYSATVGCKEIFLFHKG